MLNAVQGTDRFPVDVTRLALEYTQKVFPDDPITGVVARDFDGFEGILKKGKKEGDGWRIGYAKGITSTGRKNFTVAHELGHYFVHRHKYPNGIQCKPEDLAIWDSEYNRVEAEANRFAANLLMPFDSFRNAISPKDDVTFDDLGGVAQQFGVSLTAATLRWLEYTNKRAVFVVSRDGYILWSRSSKPAFRSGAYIKTMGLAPIEVPAASPTQSSSIDRKHYETINHPAGVWLNEAAIEHAVVSDYYELGISLLQLQNSTPVSEIGEEEVEDVFERFSKQR